MKSLFNEYNIIDRLSESKNFIFYRVKNKNNNNNSILKLLKNSISNNEISRFQNQYKTTRFYDSNELLKVQSIESYENKLLLFFEDFDCISLDSYIKSKKFNLSEFFELAINFIDVVGVLHKKNIFVHNISPNNIFIDKKNKKMKISCVYSSSEIYKKNTFEDNFDDFRYIAPEQTLKIDLPIDYRTDFYLLGLILYEILTQKPLFDLEDENDLIHSHLAIEVNDIYEIPFAISKILKKMLAKNPDDRYKSLVGIKFDLELCQEMLKEKGEITDFEIARNDISNKLEISDLFYGRKEELQNILNKFNYVKNKSQMLFVIGEKGVGKTIFVEQLRKKLFSTSLFINLNLEVSYIDNLFSSIIECCKLIIKSLLIKQEDKIIYYGNKIKEKLGDDIYSLISHFPEIKLIIDVEENVSINNTMTIQDVVKNFLEVFLESSSDAFPLVITIDEINFVDSASLLILKDLLLKNKSKNLFVIGVLSENNMTSSVILKDFLEDNEEQKNVISEIKLRNLETKYITQFISDTFNTSLENSEELSQVLIKKTDGDFNSIKDFIKDFYNEGLIYFDIHKGVWLWDTFKISTKSISDKVADFLLHRFNSFEETVKRVLNIASCIGYRFSFEVLAEISGIPPEELFMLLLDCLNEEIVVIREDNHEFSHEKLQKEIYDNIENSEKEKYHLMIAQNLIKDLNDLSDENKIFTIENHFYISKNELVNYKDIETAINIEYAASKKARYLGNYGLSLEYINKALYFIKVLDEFTNISLFIEIILEKSELCVLLNMYDDFEELQKEYFSLDLSIEHKIRLFDIKIKFYNNMGKSEKSIEIVYYILNSLDLITYQDNLNDLNDPFFKIISDINIIKTSEDKTNFFSVLKICSFELFHTYDKLFYKVFSIIESNIKDDSPDFIKAYYFSLASVLSIKDKNINKAIYLYERALVIIKNIKNFQDEFHVYYLISRFIAPFLDSNNLDEFNKKSYELSQKTGYFTKGYYCLFDQIISKINQGNNLEEIHSELKKIELFIDIIEKDSVYTFFKVLFNFVEYLLQKNDNKITIDENKFLEVMFYKEIELISEGLKYFYYIKGLKYFFSQDFSKAKIIFESLYKFLNELPYVDPLINNYFFFYTATLSELSYKNKLKDKKITKLENEIDSYKLILDDTNGIFYSKYLFILAEINRIKGLSYRDISDIYEQSFEIAKSKKLNMDIAIICEFSSKYNHFNKKTFLMEVYLKEAYSFYEKMSNFRKLSLIKKDITIDENIRSDSKKIITRNDVTSTNTNAISNTNDFISIIKELSDEINFNSLQEKLLKISLKNSGAQNAYLLFEKNGNLLVTAKYSIKNKDVEFFDNNFLENEKNVPQSVIYFVKRSLTHVSISNPKLDKLFENDTYLLSGKCKSLLCLPITNQGDFIGCLYLENTLSHNSFNNEIIEFLKLFLTHTSVYLKNSFFYTEMQALNEILKKNQDELELKITERTIDLIKAKEIAEAATTTKSDFLANMSHEIRTPMNAIIGIADLLAETPLKTEQTDFVKVIQNNSEILLSLINDILDFSKLEAGQIQLEQIEFSIYETIENIVEILSIKAQSKGIEIFSFIDPNIKFNLIGDQNKIKQVLMNLIGNSIKFTDSGEVFVLVERLQSDDFTKEALKISIIDTGLGISPENQKKLFKKFSQADSSITRKYGGTGLGLTISKSFIELMGGDIKLESELGLGSRFDITLDLPKTINRDINTMTLFELPNQYQVLLVEENKKLALFIEKHLLLLGFNVLTINEPFHAIDFIKNNNKAIDLLITDYNSSILNGLDLIKMLKEINIASKTLLLSPLNVMADQSIDKSISDIVITKPLKQIKFFNAISTLFGLNKETTDKDTSSNKSLQNEFNMKGKTILVAEDTLDNQKILKLILNKMGAEVVLVENGLDALEETKKFYFDLIIMDLQMPIMDGFTSTQKIREFEKTTLRERTPIIAFTAHAIKGYFEKCLDSGMDDYLTKPINKNQFINILKKWIDPRKKILVADDAEDNLFLLKNYFKKKAEYNPIFVKNGKEALDLFLKQSFSMLLMDMEMPEMDGYTATEKIRESERGKNIPIIALTGHQGADEIKKCTDSGCSDYISKPIRVKEFFDKLSKY